METKRMRLLLFIVVLLVVLSLGAFMDDIETAKEGVVIMVGGENKDGVTASGFVVGSKDGACYVVTSGKINEDDLERVYLFRSGEEVYNAVQVYCLEDYGVSVMKVLGEPAGLKPLIMNTDANDEQISELTVIGYSGSEYLTESEWTEDSIDPQEYAVEVDDAGMIDGVHYYTYKNDLDARTEGGPVLDESGRVVGVNVYLGIEETGYAAVDITHIMPYLENAEIPVMTGISYSARSILWLSGGLLAAIIVLVIVILIVKRKKHIIVGLTGVHAGKEIKLGRERVVFGRDPSQCSVVYPANQKGISRRHCEIYYEQKEKAYMLLDHSSEGTFIYGQRMTEGRPLALKDGTKFYLAEAGQMFEFNKK